MRVIAATFSFGDESVWFVEPHTLSPRLAFAGFPDRYKVLRLGARDGTPFGNYLHTMHYLDAAFGDLLDGLRRAGLLDRTVIALWGDHPAGLTWNEEFAKPFLISFL